jgi:hypothetical protein
LPQLLGHLGNKYKPIFFAILLQEPRQAQLQPRFWVLPKEYVADVNATQIYIFCFGIYSYNLLFNYSFSFVFANISFKFFLRQFDGQKQNFH